MRIEGRFLYGGPRLPGRLSFPGVGRPTGEVWFLLDSGAELSVYVPDPENPNTSQFEDFHHLPEAVIGGFGGGHPVRVAPAVLFFDSQPEGRIQISRTIAVVDPATASGFPSVLGRDVLDYVRVTVDRSAGLVRLSDPEGDLEAEQWPDGELRQPADS